MQRKYSMTGRTRAGVRSQSEKPLHLLSFWGRHDLSFGGSVVTQHVLTAMQAVGLVGSASPTWDLIQHMTGQLGVSDYVLDTSELIRLSDAVTRYAYWITIRQHELAGALMMHKRLQAAIVHRACWVIWLTSNLSCCKWY